MPRMVCHSALCSPLQQVSNKLNGFGCAGAAGDKETNRRHIKEDWMSFATCKPLLW